VRGACVFRLLQIDRRADAARRRRQVREETRQETENRDVPTARGSPVV